MANPWDNDPVVPAAASAAPWAKDPVVGSDPREASVPGSPAFLAAQAARPQWHEPTIGEKIHGSVETAINTVRDVASSVPAMAGGVASFIGALGHNFNVTTTPGPVPAGSTGYVNPSDAAAQGARGVQGFIQQHAQGLSPTPTGQDYTEQTENFVNQNLQALGPHMQIGDLAPAAVPLGNATGGASSAVGRAVGATDDAVSSGARAVAQAPTRMLTPKPDPVKLATATMVQDQFPNIAVLPHQLTVAGQSGKASVARELSDLPFAGGEEHQFNNRVAFSDYGIKSIDPTDTTGRLTPENVGKGLDIAGKDIRTQIDAAGPVPADSIKDALDAAYSAKGSKESMDAVQGQIDELRALVGSDGTISPAAVHGWDSRIGYEIRGAADGNVAHRLSNLQDVVRDQVNSQLTPEGQAALLDARQRYANGVELEPVARSPGVLTSGIINDPSQIYRAMNDSRSGRQAMARGKPGDLRDLARAADLVSPPAGKETMASAALHAGAHALGGATIVAPLIGRAINKAGPAATKRIIEANRPAPEPVPEPAAPLALGYDPAVSPSGGRVDLNPVAVTPEGQAVPHGQEQAREDLAVSQRNAGGTGAPPLATTYADYDTRTPEFQAPQVTVPAATPPSELAAVEHKDFQPAPSRGAREVPEPSFPHDILEPDLPQTMVAGPPGEVAATPAANEAMQSPGATAARAAQNAPPPPAAPAPKPKPVKGSQMPESKPAAEEKPPLEFDLSDPEWIKEHGGAGSLDTELTKTVAQALAIDRDATIAAGARYIGDNRGFEKAVKEIVAKGKSNANEHQPTPAGGHGAETPEGVQPPVGTGAAKAPGG